MPNHSLQSSSKFLLFQVANSYFFFPKSWLEIITYREDFSTLSPPFFNQ